MIGSTIGHYKIEEKLGEGGMGVVYKATDTKLNRPVALKFLPSHVSEAEKDKERFVQEAQAAASLSHANICTIFGIEEVDGKQFIVMEYVDGQTLQEKKQNLPLKQALEIGIQVADGLAAAHDKGIVHRDIKPENIMIKKDGTVQIMDFGLAKLRGATRLTKEGSTVGTVGYMSPEQVQGLDVDHRTDIFSLGVLLYEMIAGQSPFKGVHETAITYEIVNVDPPPIGTLKPEVDADLDAIILECLDKDPNERTQAARQVAIDLKRFRRESSRSRVSRITGSRPAYIPPAEAAGSRLTVPRSRMTSMLPWILTGLLLITTALFAWMYVAGSTEAAHEARVMISPPRGAFFGYLGGGSQAISPDGSMIAFTGIDTNRTSSLYVRRLNDVTMLKLPGTDNGRMPFWSPDNKWIGFFNGTHLMKVDPAGGSVLTICLAQGFRGASWNAADQIIYNGYPGSRALWVVSANGGDARRVTDADSTGTNSHRWPWFLPDGDHFLFTDVSNTGTNNGTIRSGSLSSQEVRDLFNARSNAVYADGSVLFYRENKIMAQTFDPGSFELEDDASVVTENVTYDPSVFRADFSVSRNGTLVQTNYGLNTSLSRSLGFFDREGRTLKAPDIQGDLFDVQLSPDGEMLAVTIGPTPSDIWVHDLRRSVTSRLTFWGGPDVEPVYSPDGRYIYFNSARDTSGASIWKKSAAGTGTEELVFSSNGWQRVSSISPDGKYLFYLQKVDNGDDHIFALPLQGEKTPISVVTGNFDHGWPAVSPDGRWIAYTTQETGTWQVYVVPFPPNGSRWQITSDQEGADGPKWNPKGGELFYQAGGTLWSVPIRTRGDVLLPGTPVPLFTSTILRGSTNYAVFPDGKRFVGITRRSSEVFYEPLLMVMNWKKEK